jgi:hypothetical protein
MPLLLLPAPHRALIEAQGGDYRLEGAPLAEPDEPERDPVGGRASSITRRPGGRREGPPAGLAPITPLLVAMDREVPWPQPSSRRAVQVVTPLLRGGPSWLPAGGMALHTFRDAAGTRMFQGLSYASRLSVVLPARLSGHNILGKITKS